MANDNGNKDYHNYDTDENQEKYVDIVKKWHGIVKDNYNNTNETRIRRWSYSNGMFKYFNNPGQIITDNNPYINIVDNEEFNLFIQNEPIPSDPPAFNNKNRLNFFGTIMDDYVDDPEWYKTTLGDSFDKIMREAKGEGVPPVAEKKEADLVKLKKELVEYAKSLGFASVGITKIDRRFISVEVDDEMIFDTIMIMGYEIPREVLQRYPTPTGDIASYYGYSHCADNVHKVADFIRSKGYDCRARSWEGFIKYSVHAVNAGMGNFSTYGINHTPEIGTRLKYCSVIIDAELPLDTPKDFNIEEFCSRCRMCQKSCPASAIPKEEHRYKGAIKRTTDHISCFNSMATRFDCCQCIRVCPISMLGYDKAMDSLPQYYMYNTERHHYNLESLLEKDGDHNE